MDIILPVLIIVIGLLLAYVAVQAMGILDVTSDALVNIFNLLIPVVCIAIFGYLVYILVNAYHPGLLDPLKRIIPGSTPAPLPPPVVPVVPTELNDTIEPFVQKPILNMSSQPVPSPAPPVRQVPVQEENRIVSPGGPGAPNAMIPEVKATISPEAAPMDPYEDMNMEAPIRDSMRHPELSFGPGIDNKGTKKGPASGTMHTRALSSESPFSPEFAQNGGQFMGEVTANDLSHDDTYATA